MNLERTVDAALEPWTTAEAKTHLRVTTSSDDTYIASLVQAARQHVELYTSRALITQTWKLRFDRDWPRVIICGEDRRRIILPRPPLLAVSAVQYVDGNGDTQILAANQYQVSGQRHVSVIAEAYGVTWPTVRDQLDAVTVTYTAGYGAAAASVPQPIRQAILLLVGHWYVNRESVVIGTTPSEVPQAVDALLFPFRVFYF